MADRLRAHKIRRWASRVAIAAATFLLLCELAGRLFLGLGKPLLYQRDVSAGYVAVPNQSVRRFGADVHVNAFSQRSKDVPEVKPPDHFRVLIVGDSVTFGTTRVGQQETFGLRVERHLAAALQQPVDVCIAATGGWALSNELGYLRSRGLFSADVVLLVLNTGDLEQPYNAGDLRSEAGYPTVRPRSAIGEAWTRYVRPRLGIGGGGGPDGSRDAGSAAATHASQREPLPEIVRQLGDVRDLVRNAGRAVVVVYVPGNSAEWRQVEFVRAEDALRKWAARSGVLLLDLGPALAAAGRDAYLDGVHLSSSGHAVVAGEIARGLAERDGRHPAGGPRRTVA